MIIGSTKKNPPTMKARTAMNRFSMATSVTLVLVSPDPQPVNLSPRELRQFPRRNARLLEPGKGHVQALQELAVVLMGTINALFSPSHSAPGIRDGGPVPPPAPATLAIGHAPAEVPAER